MTNTPDKSEMKALERVERRLNNAWAKHGFMTLTVSDLREVVSLARASSRPADQVPDMVERVARAICYEDGPQGCGCNGECKSDPFPPDDIFMRYARAAIAALQAVPAASEVGEALGECELCSKPLALGQFVNVYGDIGTAHANCEQPFAKPSEPTPAPAYDGAAMPTYVLLGEPALFETVEERPLTAAEEAELVERINANPNLRPFPEPPALKASGEE